jgi:hypothetical protein
VSGCPEESLALNLFVPVDSGMGPRAIALVLLLPQVTTIALTIAAFRASGQMGRPAVESGVMRV